MLRDTSVTIRPLETVLTGSIGPELSLLGNQEGSVTHVVDGVSKVWSCNTLPVCWVMGCCWFRAHWQFNRFFAGSSCPREGGKVLSPEGVLIAGRLSVIHRAGSEVQPWSEGQTIRKTQESS